MIPIRKGYLPFFFVAFLGAFFIAHCPLVGFSPTEWAQPLQLVRCRAP